MKSIMILGTGSHVGKSTIVAAVCRFLANLKLKVAPFKSQNMSLNSFVTLDKAEISSSIALQAKAARQTPTVYMNPILIKPYSDNRSQVIFNGLAVANVAAIDLFSAKEWYEKRKKIIEIAIANLQKEFNLIVAEGAGSCAEPNFMHSDLVNLKIAKLLDANCFLVVDIDKGGVFAEIIGTLHIIKSMTPDYLPYLKGIIINKFRGDRAILQPAIDYIEAETRLPVVAVLPFLVDLNIEQEDRVNPAPCLNPEIDIVVIYLPHIANSNDFLYLTFEKNVRVRFVKQPSLAGEPDLIIIPGSKSVISDLNYLKKIGWQEYLQSKHEQIPIFGICGGYEMMGKKISDKGLYDGQLSSATGFGFFDFDVTFNKHKIVSQVEYKASKFSATFFQGQIYGFEIHRGQINQKKYYPPLFESTDGLLEGLFVEEELLLGTFVHDLFKNANFSRSFVNYLRLKKNLVADESPLVDYESEFDRQLDSFSKLISHEKLGSILCQAG